MASRRLNRTNGGGRKTAMPPKRARATKAQQAARSRFLAELAKKGVVPSEDGIQAILRELEDG
jgi:hypothetical protein